MAASTDRFEKEAVRHISQAFQIDRSHLSNRMVRVEWWRERLKQMKSESNQCTVTTLPGRLASRSPTELIRHPARKTKSGPALIEIRQAIRKMHC